MILLKKLKIILNDIPKKKYKKNENKELNWERTT